MCAFWFAYNHTGITNPYWSKGRACTAISLDALHVSMCCCKGTKAAQAQPVSLCEHCNSLASHSLIHLDATSPCFALQVRFDSRGCLWHDHIALHSVYSRFVLNYIHQWAGLCTCVHVWTAISCQLLLYLDRYSGCKQEVYWS